jgi:methionyl-tRNA formyltransferase
MRILFAGSPSIAIPSLEMLALRHDVCAVLTTTDRQSGRGRRSEPSPVKLRAQELGIPVIEAERLDAGVSERIRELDPRIMVIAAFGKIFKKDFIDLFPLGGINFHPSLLPRYRGASPIPAAILAGDHETGITIHRLALKLDAGEILAQRKIPLKGDETTDSLSREFAARGAELLADVMERLESGAVEGVPQDEREATYCRLVKKEDGAIDWKEGAESIERKVRAYDPWPRASTSWLGQTLLVLKSRVYPGTFGGVSGHPDTIGSRPGEVLGPNPEYGLLVRTGAGILALERLQLQFKKPLEWRSFLNGHPDVIGARFGG